MTLREIERRWLELGCPDMKVRRIGECVIISVG